jgi:hypothetical protein
VHSAISLRFSLNPAKPLCMHSDMRCAALCILLLFTWISAVRAEQTFTSVDEQLAYLANLPEEQLAVYDIAYLNLVCAQGLNGSEDLDIPACIARLDEMAAHIGPRLRPGDIYTSAIPLHSRTAWGTSMQSAW